jgi:hypothetical protein
MEAGEWWKFAAKEDAVAFLTVAFDRERGTLDLEL